MSKFTPGPWKWFETENGDARVNPQNGGLVIAQCSVRDPFDTEQSANARLIATAPDLLAMCEELAECSDYWSEYDVPIGLAERLRDVIAKAKGEE